MNKPNNGGPAFPRTDGHYSSKQDGMSLRDYFAAKAMQGVLACPTASWYDGTGSSPAESYARQAYALADAMLAERDK